MAVAELSHAGQQFVESPSQKAWPLSFVPENRSGLVSEELISIASHELNHAFVALEYGVPI
jgi:hypothetical protein